MSRSRLADLLIAGLAVIAIGLSLMAFRATNTPAPASPNMAHLTATPPDAAITSAPPGEQLADDLAAATTEAPDPGTTLATWTAAVEADGADVLVVGDAYSNLPSQWVQLWATLESADRPVTIHHWGEAADVSFNEPIVLSTGDAQPLTVWSASRAGTTIADAAERAELFVSESGSPDAVLVSLGEASAGEDVAAGLDALVEALPEVPVLLSVGPAGLYEPGVGDAIAEWGGQHTDQVVTLDLREVTADQPTADEWAQAFQDALDG